MFNWATIIVLGFGNLAALDFQARVFSAKSPKVAQLGSARTALAGSIVAADFSVKQFRCSILLYQCMYECLGH